MWTLLRKKGKRYPLQPAVQATRVASGVLNVGVFLWSSARAGLRRFFFVEDRAEVREARGSQDPVSWVGLSHPQEAAASGPGRLGATAEEAQPGAARPQWEHVGLGLGCELLLRSGHRVKEAWRRNLGGSAVAWRGLLGPQALHETWKEDVSKSVAGRARARGVRCEVSR